MSDFFASGRVADLIILVLAVEGVLVWRRGRRSGQTSKLEATGPVLMSGVFFALALRGALVGAGWPWIAAPLVGAFAAHLTWIAPGYRDRG